MPRRLIFVSPRFLFPADSGGKIRTTQILRGMKHGPFELTLVSPEPPAAGDRFRRELDEVCDRFVGWNETRRGPLFRLTRLRHALAREPIPVATDRSRDGRAAIERQLASEPDVAVFDFAHAAVLAPDAIDVPTVLFTHNVESWIFRRHAEVASNPVVRWAWRRQWRKMERFEQAALARFDTVVAVSDGDARFFRERYGANNVRLIPTGVDLGYFGYEPPGDGDGVVFIGAMDWLANQDGVGWLLDEVWPRIAASRPTADMRVVGRQPPASLVRRADGQRWSFTGFVDDVRTHVRGRSVCVIPLRVGGGTRIKAFEAMAMGCPVVSTSIGVEGLPLEDGVHYLRADTADEFSGAVLRLLVDSQLRTRISAAARRHVEEHFSARRAASVFQDICLETSNDHRSGYQQTP
ncbi:MAG TPA: glycosyltransferase family 4 protein [Candidatus Polarisedimenticolaceae bacterium]|nr:glycosyltransferase family 4 protein [Candidatus Polarisedimenticolaceae bacterium]